MKKLMIAIITATVLSGCAQQTFKINNSIAEKPTQETRQSFFLNGIGQSQTIDAASVCGGADKVVRTEVQESGMDVFLRVITIGIYTPREVRVYCSKWYFKQVFQEYLLKFMIVCNSLLIKYS